jgi:hypothetical protein
MTKRKVSPKLKGHKARRTRPAKMTRRQWLTAQARKGYGKAKGHAKASATKAKSHAVKKGKSYWEQLKTMKWA